MKTICIIPARGKSKGIPRKNLIELLGVPLIAYSIRAGLEANLIDKVFVSTEDDEIASVSEKYGANIIRHPENLSADEIPSFRVLEYDVEYLDAKNEKSDYIVVLRATSPLRTSKDTEEVVNKLIESGADSVISVTQIDRYHPYRMFYMDEDSLIRVTGAEGEFPMRRQNLPKVYMRNGAIYAARAPVIRAGSLWGHNIKAYIMPFERSLNINNFDDIKEAERYLVSSDIHDH